MRAAKFIEDELLPIADYCCFAYNDDPLDSAHCLYALVYVPCYSLPQIQDYCRGFIDLLYIKPIPISTNPSDIAAEIYQFSQIFMLKFEIYGDMPDINSESLGTEDTVSSVEGSSTEDLDYDPWLSSSHSSSNTEEMDYSSEESTLSL
ncbi:MAG: hypothetical protein QW515_05235 [Thermoplasmatales archaeon]